MYVTYVSLSTEQNHFTNSQDSNKKNTLHLIYQHSVPPHRLELQILDSPLDQLPNIKGEKVSKQA